MQEKKRNTPLTAMLRKRSYCLKTFVLLTWAGVFIWDNFHPGVAYKHIEIFTKESVARRDLGNRASPG